jgi:signal transduction histidine kinase
MFWANRSHYYHGLLAEVRNDLDQQHSDLISALIFHECVAVGRSDEQLIAKYRRLGVLGTSLLLSRQYERFIQWTEMIEQRTASFKSGLIDNVVSFYEHLHSNADDDIRGIYRRSIIQLRELLDGLSPDSYVSDVRQTRGYRALLDMASVTRLLSRGIRNVLIDDVIDEILLLRSKGGGKLTICNKTNRLLIVEREGEFQALIDAVISEVSARFGIVDVMLCVIEGDLRETVTISLDWNVRLSSGDLLQHLRSTLLWEFLSMDIPILDVRATGPNGIEIRCGAFGSTVNGFTNRALRAFFRSPYRVLSAESVALAKLLHDLKNQLLAFHGILTRLTNIDRTSTYRARLMASEHLDKANVLMRSVETIARSLKDPVFQTVDAGEMFRQYAAAQIATLPNGIRLDPPRATSAAMICTDPELVLGIVENLIKNSVEAMPGGGEIRLDWLYDDVAQTLLIEVGDTGPGIETDRLLLLLAGVGVQSPKVGGSGLGMLTVKAMLDRLNGELSATSELGRGTSWTITIPTASACAEGSADGTAEAFEEARVDEDLGDD